MLDDAGVPCFVKNEFIQGASGEIPPHEALPEIWLQDSEWLNKATKLLQQLEEDLSNFDNTIWQCAQCHEENDGEFKICWNCQRSR